ASMASPPGSASGSPSRRVGGKRVDSTDEVPEHGIPVAGDTGIRDGAHRREASLTFVDGDRAGQREDLVPLEVHHLTAQPPLVPGDDLRAGKKARDWASGEAGGQLVEGEIPREIQLGWSDGRQLPIEDRADATVFGEQDVAEPSVTPAERGRRLGHRGG